MKFIFIYICTFSFTYICFTIIYILFRSKRVAGLILAVAGVLPIIFAVCCFLFYIAHKRGKLPDMEKRRDPTAVSYLFLSNIVYFFKQSIFIMIPLTKKVNVMECNNYRTISLIPHASKIILRIITKRIQGRARVKHQFSFSKCMGRREAIMVMRRRCEESCEYDNDVCFIRCQSKC